MGKRGPKPKFNDVACPNAKCSCYGVAGKGNVTSNGTSKIKSGGQVRKFICSACGLVFCSRKNTVFYGLRTSPEKITLALDLSTKGLSVNKIAEVVKVCPVTVRKWTGKAASHCKKVNESTLKYEDRITHRKIHDAMMRLFGLKISPATILDLSRRAADAVQSEYDAELYEILIEALENDPPPKVRKTLWQLAREALRHWIGKEYSIEEVRKFIGKINNGFDYWFTFIINPGVEPTNNRAERALRPHVVLRKILGTLRNDKGTSIHERIMTTLATWGQRGLNSLQMLTEKLAS